MLRLWSILLLLFCVAALASAMPLQKGMELRYEGELTERFTFKNRTIYSFLSRVISFVVLDSSPQKVAEIVQLDMWTWRSGESLSRSSDIRFGKVNLSGKVSSSGTRSLTLPYIFIPPKQLKEGKVWGSDEVLSIGFFPTPLKGRVVYKVLGKRDVDGINCWLILRHLSKPVTLVGEDKRTYVVPLWTEWLWIDAQTGLVRRFKRRYKDYTLHIVPHPASEVLLNISLKRIAHLSPEAQAQLQSEISKMSSIVKMLERDFERIKNSEERLKQAELILKEAISELRESPYADFYTPYLEIGLEDVLYWQKRLEAKNLVGNPAPDFELPTIDRTAKVKLSDLRGKVIFLNFFSHW